MVDFAIVYQRLHLVMLFLLCFKVDHSLSWNGAIDEVFGRPEARLQAAHLYDIGGSPGSLLAACYSMLQQRVIYVDDFFAD